MATRAITVETSAGYDVMMAVWKEMEPLGDGLDFESCSWAGLRARPGKAVTGAVPEEGARPVHATSGAPYLQPLRQTLPLLEPCLPPRATCTKYLACTGLPGTTLDRGNGLFQLPRFHKLARTAHVHAGGR